MAGKKGEKHEKITETSIVEFDLDDDSGDFHAGDADKNAKDAEIISETRNETFIKSDETTRELTGVAALLANLDAEKEVSLIIKRLADKQYKNQFRVPCELDCTLETVIWDGEPLPNNHYQYVQKKYGGGIYRFQLHYDGGFKEAWKETLSDPAEFSEKELLIIREKEKAKTDEQPRTVEISQPFAQVQPPAPTDPLSSAREFMGLFKEVKDFEKSIAPPMQPAPAPVEQPAQAAARVTKLDFIMALYKETQDASARNKIINSVLEVQTTPAEIEPKGFFGSIADTFAQSPRLQEKAGDFLEGISQLVSVGFSRFIGAGENQTAPPVTGLNSIRQTRAEPAPASPAQNAPQGAPTAQTAPIEPKPELIPFIALED